MDLIGTKKKKRKDFSRGIIIDTLVEQDFKCANCNQQFSKGRRPHFDHKDGNAKNNIASNCQALCPNCHDQKSVDENRRRDEKEKQKRQDPTYLDPKLFEI